MSTEEYGLRVNGILVEPIKEYCDVLPHSDKVLIECCAISDKDREQIINAIIVPRPMYISKGTMKVVTRELGNVLESLIQMVGGWGFGQSSFLHPSKFKFKPPTPTPRVVKTLTLKSFFDKYNVTEIGQLKIDVEGYEEILLIQLLDLMRTGAVKITERLIFEYNNLSNTQALDMLRDKIANEFDFKWQFVEEGWNEDIIMEKI